MKSVKLKSSAILLALALGVMFSGLVIGISVAMSQYSKISAQAREGKLAYRAALSGIEDGLLRYKYARALNLEDSIFGELGEFNIANQSPLINPTQPSARYKLAIKMDSVSVGKGVVVNNILSDIDNLSDPDNAAKGFIDQTTDINLTYLTANLPSGDSPLDIITIFFTPPYQEVTGNDPQQISGYFTALNARLINVSASAEEQLVWEKTIVSPTDNKILISEVGIDKCKLAGANCHLRLKPQLASTTIPFNGNVARRISGSGNTLPASNKFTFYAIRAMREDGSTILPTGNEPGTITISSIGIAGQAVRKLDAHINAGNGNYLGLFDYGIYCGSECIGL